MKINKKYVIVGAVLLVLLVSVAMCLGIKNTERENNVLPKATTAVLIDEENYSKKSSQNQAENADNSDTQTDSEAEKESENAKDAEYSQNQRMNIDEKTGVDEYKTEPVPDGKPVPQEPQKTVKEDTKLTCTLSVRCDTVLDNMSKLEKGKSEIIPGDGIIFTEKQVEFTDGESVFDLLVREMKNNKIHLEFEKVPMYNSAYIEGIGNLYEFDCGELSGWMYKVNDWFPNYGCSRYRLKQGDKVEWIYTCDLGKDIGGDQKEQMTR